MTSYRRALTSLPAGARTLMRDLRVWGRSQGWTQALWNRLVAHRMPGEYQRVYLAGVRGAVFLRRSGSDWSVFRQIFTTSEYDLLLSRLGDVSTVVDGGANIGLATIAIKRRRPDARVVAIEPDVGNFKLLERNVARYGSSVSVTRAAIWDRSGNLNVLTGCFRDGEDWATIVREPSNVEEERPCIRQTVEALCLTDLMSLFDLVRVDLLKLDIEGAEARVFTGPDPKWQDSVVTIAVELHPDSPEGDPTSKFFELFGDTWHHFMVGELNVATRQSAGVSEAGDTR